MYVFTYMYTFLYKPNFRKEQETFLENCFLPTVDPLGSFHLFGTDIS